MDTIEAATLITLKAIETSRLVLKVKGEATMEEANTFNAEQIAKFYKTVNDAIKNNR